MKILDFLQKYGSVIAIVILVILAIFVVTRNTKPEINDYLEDQNTVSQISIDSVKAREQAYEIEIAKLEEREKNGEVVIRTLKEQLKINNEKYENNQTFIPVTDLTDEQYRYITNYKFEPF